MKRFALKPWLVIFAALCLFAIYLLVCFPLLNTTVFRWENNRGELKNAKQLSDSARSSNGNAISSSSSDIANNIFTFNFNNPVSPEISDYILVSITAINTGQAKYPYGSIAVNLSEEKIDLLNSAAPGSNNTEANTAGSPGIYHLQERLRIFVDGIRHSYYIPVGENKYWRHDWNLDGPTLKGQISSLELEIPRKDGVDIQINSIALNKRLVFAADSHINYFFKNYFQLSYIDRFLTPANIFLILFAAVFFLSCFLLKKTGGINKIAVAGDLKSGDSKSHIDGKGYIDCGPVVIDFKSADSKSLDLKDRDSSFCTANATNIHAGNLDSNSKRNIGSILKGSGLAGTGFGFKTFAMLVPLLLLVFFSFYFISNYIFTAKGYWDSYKQYILSGRLDETYYGFSDFEKFVTWVGEKVPQGQNVIVLVKGEPIYIMAQMAYGLYPRDIKFINISSMSSGEVADKITSLNLTYEYIVVLSETDKVFLESVKVKTEYSYRENAGFLYKLSLK